MVLAFMDKITISRLHIYYTYTIIPEPSLPPTLQGVTTARLHTYGYHDHTTQQPSYSYTSTLTKPSYSQKQKCCVYLAALPALKQLTHSSNAPWQPRGCCHRDKGIQKPYSYPRTKCKYHCQKLDGQYPRKLSQELQARYSGIPICQLLGCSLENQVWP